MKKLSLLIIAALCLIGCEKDRETIYPVSGNVYEVYELGMHSYVYYFVNDTILFYGDGPDQMLNRADSYKWIDTFYYNQILNDLYIYKMDNKTKVIRLGKSYENFITIGGSVYNLTERYYPKYRWP